MSFEAQLKSDYALAHDRLIYPNGKPKPVAVSPPGKVKKPVKITKISPVSTPQPTMASLLRLVSDTEGISTIFLRGPRHSKPVCLVRSIFCYLARTYTDASSPSIGIFLGDRDHTTILSAVIKIKTLRLKDPDVCQRVAYYETILDSKYVDRVDDSGGIMCPHCLRFFKLA